jgi:CheY-like chemotaxis protein
MHTVLVVDDGPHIAALEAELLRASGRHAQVVADGVEARALLEQTDVDLILLDLNTPQLSGQEVLDHLSEHPRLRHIPVVVLSGNMTTLCSTPQVVGLLDKPFDVQALAAAIERILPLSPDALPQRNQALLT